MSRTFLRLKLKVGKSKSNFFLQSEKRKNPYTLTLFLRKLCLKEWFKSTFCLWNLIVTDAWNFVAPSSQSKRVTQFSGLHTKKMHTLWCDGKTRTYDDIWTSLFQLIRIFLLCIIYVTLSLSMYILYSVYVSCLYFNPSVFLLLSFNILFSDWNISTSWKEVIACQGEQKKLPAIIFMSLIL